MAVWRTKRDDFGGDRCEVEGDVLCYGDRP